MTRRIQRAALLSFAIVAELLGHLAAAQTEPPIYRQTFNALAANKAWSGNLQSVKVTDHPENAMVTAACGPDGSNCLRIVYRHADGIHKEPFPAPAFAMTGGMPSWTPAAANTTTTGTDVIQRDISISASTNDKGKSTDAAVSAKAYTLTYDVYFEPGFDFAKGGKLPGLAAANFDSGCTEDGNSKRSPKNWSVRLMWRANGRVEIYSYDQSRPSGSCGVRYLIDQGPGETAENSSEYPGVIPNDGKFRLKPGAWYTFRLSVQVNSNDRVRYKNGEPVQDAAYTDGKISLLVSDGTASRLLIAPGIPLRDECNGACPAGVAVPDSPETWVSVFFFSTFFGGNETKRLTCNQTAAQLSLSDEHYAGLCASQDALKHPNLFPKISWQPLTASAARFDNITIQPGYTEATTLVKP